MLRTPDTSRGPPARMKRRRLKIAYLSDEPPGDRWSHSGGNARILAALERHAGEVTVLPVHWFAAEPLRRAVQALPEALAIRVRWRLQLLAAPLIARGLARELARDRFDVLFCSYAFQALAALRTPYPLLRVFSSDATPSSFRRSALGERFGSYLSASRLLDPLIRRAEGRVLRGNDLNLWPSDWQKRQADALFSLAPECSLVVPWGANIDTAPPPRDPALPGPGEALELLFLGRDWEAKGGPLALQVLARLNDGGTPARLTIIGCSPPEPLPAQTELHPFIDKTRPEGAALLAALFGRAHFMLMPSFESYGFAFCEASAHGLPVLCLDVGGVPVTEGVNGFALPAGSSADAFAGLIRRQIADAGAYGALRENARARYRRVLNWDAWGERVAGLLHARL